MHVTRDGSVKIAAKQGTITITADGITVPRTGRRLIGTYEKSRSGLAMTLNLTVRDVHQVTVAGNDKKYMTGNRAAGAVLTGGAVLLAPTRVRGVLVISTTAGDVLEYTLLRPDAAHPEAVAAAFASRGYDVR